MIAPECQVSCRTASPISTSDLPPSSSSPTWAPLLVLSCCWLQRTGRSEEEILRHYRLTSLEELPALTATRILERLIRLDHDTCQVRRRDGGEAR